MTPDDAARDDVTSRWVRDHGAVEENLVELCEEWVDEQDAEDDDGGSVFDGLLYGLALSVPFWGLAVVLVGWPWGAQWTG